MSLKTSPALDPRYVDETEVRALYRQMLNGWNQRRPDAIADLFIEDGDAIGFDGTELKGQAEIAAIHRRIFADHRTGVFVGKVRSVRFLGPDVAVVSAVAGMVMPGQSDLEPERNSVQTLVAVKPNGHWHAAVFQNTPARFHGRPEEAEALTEELRKLL